MATIPGPIKSKKIKFFCKGKTLYEKFRYTSQDLRMCKGKYTRKKFRYTSQDLHG